MTCWPKLSFLHLNVTSSISSISFLCSSFAKLITGGTVYVDGGYNIRG
jgi:enoyl-[acyl-carrier-protein] reductase (NADH)